MKCTQNLNRNNWIESKIKAACCFFFNSIEKNWQDEKAIEPFERSLTVKPFISLCTANFQRLLKRLYTRAALQ